MVGLVLSKNEAPLCLLLQSPPSVRSQQVLQRLLEVHPVVVVAKLNLLATVHVAVNWFSKLQNGSSGVVSVGHTVLVLEDPAAHRASAGVIVGPQLAGGTWHL